jgi:hypothetical protein
MICISVIFMVARADAKSSNFAGAMLPIRLLTRAIAAGLHRRSGGALKKSYASSRRCARAIIEAARIFSVGVTMVR